MRGRCPPHPRAGGGAYTSRPAGHCGPHGPPPLEPDSSPPGIEQPPTPPTPNFSVMASMLQYPMDMLCRTCHSTFHHSSFPIRSTGDRKGNYRTSCRACCKKLQRRRWRRNNRFKTTMDRINWQQKCKVSGKAREYKLKFNYGPNFTVAEFESLWDKQEGKCSICNCQLTLGRRGMKSICHIDHDHVTGSVRGLLCGKCNTGLGCFNDKQELLENAAKYLR